MIALALCILLNTAIFVLFREFDRRGLSRAQYIPVNYLVCTALALAFDPKLVHMTLHAGPDWLWLAGLQGLLFIVMFNVIGGAVPRAGIAYTALMTKVSVVVPVAVAVLAFGERLDGLRGLGIAAALVAIVLLHWGPLRRPHPQTLHGWALAGLGALLFVGSGAIDTQFKLFDEWYGRGVSGSAFIALVFAVAAVLGFAYLGYRIGAGHERLGMRHLLAGVLLGVPNYFSVYCLVWALRELPATLFFPANNIGQLLLAGLVGTLVYRERLDRLGWLGLMLAALAIALIVV